MERPGRPRDEEATDPPRLWTVAEADARIAGLEELLPRLKGWVLRLGQVHDELKRLSEFWGTDVDAQDHADHELKTRLDAEWHHLTQRLEEAVGALRSEGIEVKNLETGLVDFYSLQGGEVVFLCWQRGESAVGFFHTLTGGYRSRRPIAELGETPSPRAHGSG
jgi:hypothetical protein